MTLPGLALFYAGLVQSKNVVSVLCQHFGIACLMSIIWVIFGYSLAFSQGESNLVGNLEKLFLSIPSDSLVGTIPEDLFAMFQMTFCIITPRFGNWGLCRKDQVFCYSIFLTSLACGCLLSSCLLGLGWRFWRKWV